MRAWRAWSTGAAGRGQARLRARGRAEIVFLGDSITEQWLERAPAFFRGGRLDMGVGGETTGGLLVRFDRDVAAFGPRVVHVMGGTNDLWHGQPGEGAADALANLAAIVARAKAAGIAVVLAAPPPIGAAAAAEFARPELFPALLDGIAALAAAQALVHVDYARSLTDAGGRLRPECTTDGVHLSAEGYRAMADQAEAALAQALTGRNGR